MTCFVSSMGPFWKGFGVILRLKIVLETLWGSVLVGARFSGFDAAYSGGFWGPFRKVFGYILVSYVHVNFIMDFYLILQWILMDFGTLWTSKNEHFVWRVLQKSNFRLVCYRMHIRIDFGWILGPGSRQFWVPIGVQKRLREQWL